MKYYTIIAFIGLLPFISNAQTTEPARKLGFALNSSINGELLSIGLVPSITYTKGKNQLELGIGTYPFNRDRQTMLSCEFNQKYYPNGWANKYNMYFMTRAAYFNNRVKTFYPATYKYLFLNAGYGLEVSPIPSAGFYMGTNMTLGTFTVSSTSEVPHKAFQKQDLFQEFGFNLAFQASVGYRF